MSYENETVVKAGGLTYSAITSDMGIGSIAQAAAGSAVGGFLGNALVNESNRKALESTIGGIGVLTNARYIFGKGKGFKKLAAGSPCALTPKDEVYFDIPFAGIASVKQGKQGLSPAFFLELEGGAEVGFCAMKKSAIEEWEAALHQTIGK